jgi:hypothetical protein
VEVAAALAADEAMHVDGEAMHVDGEAMHVDGEAMHVDGEADVQDPLPVVEADPQLDDNSQSDEVLLSPNIFGG